MSEASGSGRRERIVELLREARRAIMGSELMISSHRDVERYAEVLHTSGTQPLSSLTGGGVHRHRVRAPDDVALASARGDLELLGFLHQG